MNRPFFECVPRARTWGTPDLGQKAISLDAILTTFYEEMGNILWQI